MCAGHGCRVPWLAGCRALRTFPPAPDWLGKARRCLTTHPAVMEAYLEETIGLQPDPAKEYAQRLVEQGFDDVEGFESLSLKELASTFGFKKGHVLKVERFRNGGATPGGARHGPGEPPGVDTRVAVSPTAGHDRVAGGAPSEGAPENFIAEHTPSPRPFGAGVRQPSLRDIAHQVAAQVGFDPPQALPGIATRARSELGLPPKQDGLTLKDDLAELGLPTRNIE